MSSPFRGLPSWEANGWAYRYKKYHFYREGRSLCGRRRFAEACDPRPTTPTRFDCRLCWRSLMKKKTKGKPTINPEAWRVPDQVQPVDVAFPGDVAHLVPPEKDFVDDASPWLKVATAAFFDTQKMLLGLRVRAPFNATQASRMKVLMTLNAVLGSYGYKHEVKLRQAATLMSLWCEA